jgi:multiple sugar transport system substrate-binding protein
VIASLGGCGGDAPEGADVLTVWAHAGQPEERRVLEDQIQRFDAARPDLAVELTLIPEQTYNAQVQAAALAGDLPDLLELDGPYLASYAWQGHLQPLDGLLPPQRTEDLLPSLLAQGRYAGRLYGVGTFESGLGLFVRPSRVEAAGFALPERPQNAWPVARFEALLARLAADDPDGAVLDLKLNYQGEWPTYGFAPVLHSAGGGLVSRNGSLQAAGTLDSPASVAALAHLQRWMQEGLVDPNVDDAAFTAGRVALSWVGHWAWPAYREAHGADVAVVPLPDFGAGTRTGQGSWAWGITAQAARPGDAAALLAFLLEPDEVLAMTRANGAIPGTRSALARSRLYGPGGPLRLLAVQLLEGHGVPRPRTPAYPFITSTFQDVFRRLRDGADPEGLLREAARAIDREVADNRGYPAPGEAP